MVVKKEFTCWESNSSLPSTIEFLNHFTKLAYKTLNIPQIVTVMSEATI
jgi:hypothetical protein